MISIRKVLVPIDFSRSSEKAAHYGIEISRDRGAKVSFVHVINQRVIDAVQELNIRGYKGNFVEAVKKLIHDREKDLIQFVPESLREGLETEFIIRKGKPSEEIVLVAEELSIDLIVLGSQGHSVSTSTLVGSVAQHVVSHAPCPVLVVRPAPHDFIE